MLLSKGFSFTYSNREDLFYGLWMSFGVTNLDSCAVLARARGTKSIATTITKFDEKTKRKISDR